MMKIDHTTSLRILIAEDDPSTAAIYRKVLAPKEGKTSGSHPESLAVSPFDNDAGRTLTERPVDLVVCRQAIEAVESVKTALDEQSPFALAFIDVLMPPGPDGIWAAEQLRLLDPFMEIVIVTAHSDIQSKEITRRVPPPHKLLYLQKPLHLQEIKHFAYSLCSKWLMENELRNVKEKLEIEVEERTAELTRVNKTLREDIIRREEAEEKSRSLENMLRQAQKMEAIGTLAGGIAHDFNNILSAIFGYAQLAQLNIPDNSKVQGYIQQLLRASDRAKGLIRQILAFSRQSTFKKIPTDIGTVAIDSLELMKALVPAHIEVHDTLQPGLSAVMADHNQIHQVIINLFTNALSAMEKTGGVIEIALDPVEIGMESAAGSQAVAPGSYLKLTVRDTGCGIVPDIIPRIFEPYFTTKEVGKGTGMGLAMVHGIVKEHGGTVQVESIPGEGTAFYIYLPVINDAVKAKILKHNSLPRGSERILFVDDEKFLVDIGYQMLSELGYTVETRTSPYDALDDFRMNCEKYDLVITDMNMPGMTGEGLAAEIKTIRPDIPILLCTGFSNPLMHEKGIKSLFSKVLMKPFTMNKLAGTVRKLLNSET